MGAIHGPSSLWIALSAAVELSPRARRIAFSDYIPARHKGYGYVYVCMYTQCHSSTQCIKKPSEVCAIYARTCVLIVLAYQLQIENVHAAVAQCRHHSGYVLAWSLSLTEVRIIQSIDRRAHFVSNCGEGEREREREVLLTILRAIYWIESES